MGERIQEAGERLEDKFKHSGPGHAEQRLEAQAEHKEHQLKQGAQHMEDKFKDSGLGRTVQHVEHKVEGKAHQLKEGAQHAVDDVRSHMPGFLGGTGGEKHHTG